MTSEEKKSVYTLLKTVSSHLQGYTSPAFSEEMYFEDDFVEVVEAARDDSITAEKIEAAREDAGAAEQNKTQNVGEPAQVLSVQTQEVLTQNAGEPEQAAASLLQKTEIRPKISGGVTLDSIALKISSCKKCLLSSTRKNTVPGEGVINPLVLVIGEGPGEDESEQSALRSSAADQQATPGHCQRHA